MLARSSPVFLHKSLHSFPHLQALSVKSNQTQSDAKQMIQFQRHIAYMQGFEKCNFMQASPHSSRDVPGNFLFRGVRIFWDSDEQSFSLPLSPHHHMHKTAISRSLFPLPQLSHHVCDNFTDHSVDRDCGFQNQVLRPATPRLLHYFNGGTTLRTHAESVLKTTFMKSMTTHVLHELFQFVTHSWTSSTARACSHWSLTTRRLQNTQDDGHWSRNARGTGNAQ